jgi:TPR repeat protein
VNDPARNDDAIARLVKRGKGVMTDGDVVAARLLLQRAAEAGSAEAALALGASFDPLIMKQTGAIGVKTDAAQARQWYEKAAALGSEAASKQLAKLASAGQ